MKLIRFGQPGQEMPGIIDEHETWLNVAGFGEDFGESFFASNGISRLKDWL